MEIDEDDKCMVTVKCAKCGKSFEIKFDEYSISTIRVLSCTSGGIYSIKIVCPHCEYDLEIY